MKHAFGELYGSRFFDDMEYLEQCMRDVLEDLDFNILNSYFHKFQPQGVTGMFVISESHFTIHTWPEKGYAAVDLFTCGDASPKQGILMLANMLGASCEIREIDRDVSEGECSELALERGSGSFDS